MIYTDAEVARAVGEDPQSAPIPELHKAMFRLAKTFVQNSWTANRADIEALRALGVSESDISEWLQIASIQTWFTNSADAGGIPLEGNAVTGPLLHRSRDFYDAMAVPEHAPPGKLDNDSDTWLQPDYTSTGYADARRWALARYGFVPGLIDALSACPDFYLRHQLALELLEAPQSTSLSPSLHALVRATVVALDHCHYFQPTVAEQLQRMANRTIEPASLRESPGSHSDDAQTLVVLEFVQKMHKNPFKITPADAEAFRAAGLDDAAYVDVFNTVAIQQSLDRLANYSGVRADNQPLLSQDNQAA